MRQKSTSYTQGKHLAFIIAAVASATSLHAQATTAQSTITIQAAGLSCTTTAGAGAFSAINWSMGASNPSAVGASAGKAALSDLQILKPFDGCSAALFQFAMSGRPIPNVKLTQNDSKDNPVTVIQVNNVLVENYQLGGSSTTANPAESLALRFTQISITSPNGAHVCWNAQTQAGC